MYYVFSVCNGMKKKIHASMPSAREAIPLRNYNMLWGGRFAHNVHGNGPMVLVFWLAA